MILIAKLSTKEIAERLSPVVETTETTDYTCKDIKRISKEELNGIELGKLEEKDLDNLEFIYRRDVFELDTSLLVKPVINILKERLVSMNSIDCSQ